MRVLKVIGGVSARLTYSQKHSSFTGIGRVKGAGIDDRW